MLDVVNPFATNDVLIRGTQDCDSHYSPLKCGNLNIHGFLPTWPVRTGLHIFEGLGIMLEVFQSCYDYGHVKFSMEYIINIVIIGINEG
jgi:hypothetical protein